MQESSLANGSSAAESNYSGQFSENGFINHGSYLLESKLLEKFNFTGFAFFVQATGILDIVNHVGTPGTGDIKLLAEFTYRAKLQVIKVISTHFPFLSLVLLLLQTQGIELSEKVQSLIEKVRFLCYITA